MMPDKSDSIKSTLNINGYSTLKEVIAVDKLINDYKKQFNIDINRYFNGITELKIFECNSTKYRFFYPFNISGDSEFYEKLQQFEWYYMPWKWEHAATKIRLSATEKILEVGSGGLGFVEHMQKSGFDITGLELNKQSISSAFAMGLNVFNETVQEHADKNFEKYDVVCSYQVLEHIVEVNSFIKAQIDCLKKGGKLIISVPNNNSFIKLIKGGSLNFPPHHMGLWNKRSLLNIVKLFDLKVHEIIYEPLQDYHLDWYINSTINDCIDKNKFIKFIFNKLKLKNRYIQLVTKYQNRIHGHTIMIIYTKK